MAVDTEDKRRNLINMTLRSRLGITPSGSVETNDRENYTWYYFPFTAPSPGTPTGTGGYGAVLSVVLLEDDYKKNL